MSQTKIMSWIEVVTGTAIKFIWAMILWQTVAYWVMGYDITFSENFVITGIFTINSVVIGFIVRRWFNNLGDKK